VQLNLEEGPTAIEVCADIGIVGVCVWGGGTAAAGASSGCVVGGAFVGSCLAHVSHTCLTHASNMPPHVSHMFLHVSLTCPKLPHAVVTG
jgi:hypothetical protein